MIVRNRFGANVELRSEFGTWPIPRSWSGTISSSGVAVTSNEVLGLPAVSSVIRSPAEIIASLPFLVYRRGEPRDRAEDTWQWDLLHERPNNERNSFEFFYDLELSLEATQNAFVQKVRGVNTRRGQIDQLVMLDPQRVVARVERGTGRKLFDVMVSPSDVRRDLTGEDILHVRGFSPEPGGAMGVSLIEMHRNPLGAAIAMQRFEGDYFRNSALSPLLFNLGPSGNAEQAKTLQDAWHDQHGGPGNQFKVGVVWGIDDATPIPLSLQDAAFAEAKRLSIEDACRIWRWPKRLLELTGEDEPANEDDWSGLFLKFYLLPRLRRIERAFAADDDLFWQSGLVGEFLTAALERASFLTRIRAYKDAIQGGHMTPNETRRPENLPPHPEGDKLQFPVVGGGALEGGGEAQELSESELGEDARTQNGRRQLTGQLARPG